ncbi:MAG: 2-amino-4-hydroxy-6-hydroxymethyldihydropteridine diphosphokinase [FCB group bacterium]|nr:2-amino-4-hydroxy-6-hydroxymethyldihydropteridine diphosphokinase [FCB group bacterium]
MNSFLGVGSNTGDRSGHIITAIEKLSASDEIQVLQTSPVYETPPLYNTEQRKFLNCVIHIETILPPFKLLQLLKKIESEAGRKTAQPRNSPRPLDLDILTYENLIIRHETLQLPHPGLSERKFVLQPWADIAPEFQVAGTHQTVLELLSNCSDTSEIQIVNSDYQLIA